MNSGEVNTAPNLHRQDRGEFHHVLDDPVVPARPRDDPRRVLEILPPALFAELGQRDRAEDGRHVADLDRAEQLAFLHRRRADLPHRLGTGEAIQIKPGVLRAPARFVKPSQGSLARSSTSLLDWFARTSSNARMRCSRVMHTGQSASAPALMRCVNSGADRIQRCPAAHRLNLRAAEPVGPGGQFVHGHVVRQRPAAQPDLENLLASIAGPAAESRAGCRTGPAAGARGRAGPGDSSPRGRALLPGPRRRPSP